MVSSSSLYVTFNELRFSPASFLLLAGVWRGDDNFSLLKEFFHVPRL